MGGGYAVGLRVCAGTKDARCPTAKLIPKTRTRCAACARQFEKARGSKAERGYGAEHRRTRAALLPDAYGKPCLHCGHAMMPEQALALDHTEDRSGYRGIVHASCNASEAATRGHRHRSA